MQLPKPADEVVFETKWFQLIARCAPGCDQPHYSIKTLDYVHVVATTSEGNFLLVRQFRPAVWEETLELPGGHVEEGQTPEQAARAELLEETGYVADQFEFLGVCSPDTGRLGNRLWVYFAKDARPSCEHCDPTQDGVAHLIYNGTVTELLGENTFSNGLNRAAILSAVVLGKLKI